MFTFTQGHMLIFINILVWAVLWAAFFWLLLKLNRKFNLSVAAMLGIFIFLNLTDVVTTLCIVNINGWGAESNPVIQFFGRRMGHLFALIFLKIVVCSGFCYAVIRIKNKGKLSYKKLAGVNALFAVASLGNLLGFLV